MWGLAVSLGFKFWHDLALNIFLHGDGFLRVAFAHAALPEHQHQLKLLGSESGIERDLEQLYVQ